MTLISIIAKILKLNLQWQFIDFWSSCRQNLKQSILNVISNLSYVIKNNSWFYLIETVANKLWQMIVYLRKSIDLCDERISVSSLIYILKNITFIKKLLHSIITYNNCSLRKKALGISTFVNLSLHYWHCFNI